MSAQEKKKHSLNRTEEDNLTAPAIIKDSSSGFFFSSPLLWGFTSQLYETLYQRSTCEPRTTPGITLNLLLYCSKCKLRHSRQRNTLHFVVLLIIVAVALAQGLAEATAAHHRCRVVVPHI